MWILTPVLHEFSWRLDGVGRNLRKNLSGLRLLVIQQQNSSVPAEQGRQLRSYLRNETRYWLPATIF